jgi:hypothetical protein
MTRTLLAPALAAALAAFAAPAPAVAAPSPIYLVVDSKADPHKPNDRRTVIVRAYDSGDAGQCARGQMHYPNSPANPRFSQCLRQLPAEFATLPQGGGLPRAYVLKFTVPGETEATYRLMYDMSMKDPPQICRNLADYERRWGRLTPDTRIQCWVPRG